MNDFWKNALNVGGIVTVVAFVLWLTIGKIFEQEVLELFGNEQLFVIVLAIISGLMICLFAAILTFNKKSPSKLGESHNKAVFKDTSIQGDVVLGDKNTNKED